MFSVKAVASGAWELNAARSLLAKGPKGGLETPLYHTQMEDGMTILNMI